MNQVTPKDFVLSNEHPHAVNIPSSLVNYIGDNCPMSPNALRLVYGLIFYGQARGAGVNETIRSLGSMLSDYAEIRCVHLSNVVGTPGIRDNRWIRQAVEDLSGSPLFDHISIDGTTKLRVKLANPVFNALPSTEKARKNSIFVRLSPPDMMFRSAYRIRANILMWHCANRKWPMFKLPNVAANSPSEAVAAKRRKLAIELPSHSNEDKLLRERQRRTLLGIKPWVQCRAGWLTSIEELSRDHALSFLVMPVFDPWTDRVIRVDVKIEHRLTQWGPEKLYCGDASVRGIYEITPKGRTSLSRDEWRQKSGQTKIF
ncbi:hypothetical protein [Pseudaestuariivita rosea]|uniref:hypothetical protein n=1 Tax=Pseudaestuariivita rosea TaxID=2763263 RepID=UPI001ABB1932|nr:hypothetical protein [Pseudaestuariivita rosea]